MGTSRGRRFGLPIQRTTEYKSTPSKPDDEALSGWVEALRKGDFRYRDQIIKSHMRLVLSIAREFSTPSREDDLSGEALLALTQAVEWSGPHLADGITQPSRLNDNNITPYIAATVRRFLRDFVATDRVVFIPSSSFRKKVKEGVIDANGDTTDMALFGVLSFTASFDDNIITPQAKKEEPSYEFKEVLEMSTRNKQEQEVINYRSKGFKYQEIADIMKLDLAKISRISSRVEARFNLLYA